MLTTPCSEVVWRVLATHSIRQFPLHFPSCGSPCVIIFQQDSTTHLTTAEIFVQIRIGATWNKNQTSIIRSPWLSFGNKSNRKCPLIGILCVTFEEHLLWATQKRISLDKLFAQRMSDESKRKVRSLSLRPHSKWALRPPRGFTQRRFVVCNLRFGRKLTTLCVSENWKGYVVKQNYVNWGVFNGYTIQQLHVSAFSGHLHTYRKYITQ